MNDRRKHELAYEILKYWTKCTGNMLSDKAHIELAARLGIAVSEIALCQHLVIADAVEETVLESLQL